MVRALTTLDWGRSLRFFRPRGLALDPAFEDVREVVTAATPLTALFTRKDEGIAALAGTLDGLFADVESVGLACQRCEMQSLVALAATEFEQAVEGSELALDNAVGGLEAGPLAR